MGLYASYVAASDDDLRAAAADVDALPESFYDAVASWEDHPSAELDKMWHGLHAVLTGAPTAAPIAGIPLSAAVFGAEALDAGDGGYAATIASRDVADVLTALRAVDRERLANEFDGPQLTADAVYPAEIWARDDRDLLVGELLSALDELTTFYEDAQAQGLAVLVQIG